MQKQYVCEGSAALNNAAAELLEFSLFITVQVNRCLSKLDTCPDINTYFRFRQVRF